MEKTLTNIFKVINKFKVPVEEDDTRIDKNGEEITKYISYVLQFIDSARFMARSISSLANNFSKEIQKI